GQLRGGAGATGPDAEGTGVRERDLVPADGGGAQQARPPSGRVREGALGKGQAEQRHDGQQSHAPSDVRDVGVVVTLHRRQREAALVAVDAASGERRADRWDQWEIEPAYVAQALALKEQLAPALFADLRQDLGTGLSGAVVGRNARRGVQGVDDRDRAVAIAGHYVGLGDDELGLRDARDRGGGAEARVLGLL